jgi:hypothetical protein
MEDDKSGYSVHRRASEVIVIAYTDDVRVRELVIEQRIGKRAVTVVGSPRR